eukprot:9024100-Pyramimonas_sp.AAC.1
MGSSRPAWGHPLTTCRARAGYIPLFSHVASSIDPPTPCGKRPPRGTQDQADPLTVHLAPLTVHLAPLT